MRHPAAGSLALNGTTVSAGEEESKNFTGEDLANLIKNSVQKGQWEEADGKTIQFQNGLLIIRNSIDHGVESPQARQRVAAAQQTHEAIVEQRYGSGVYRSSPQIAAQLRPPAEPASLAPAGSR